MEPSAMGEEREEWPTGEEARLPITEEMQELMLAAAQYTELATSLRQKGETGRAVRTMERAVGMCAKSEYDHPALAVETARARINLAAALSEASRHRAALGAVKRAQGALGRVLAWAEACPQDFGVKSISEEARALRCAALVAESIQMELCPGGVPDSAEDAPERTAPCLAPKVTLPQIQRSARAKEEQMPPAPVKRGASHRRVGSEPRASAKLPVRPRAGTEERSDVFSDFLRNVEAERVARLGSLTDWEEHAKRRLGQVHRSAQLQLDLGGDEELKEKRYTHTGHQVFMKAMRKANRCWSDPVLVQEAAKEKATPEICQIRKLNRQLYVKPPTPPPAPTKPKVDQSLANNLRSNQRSSVLAS
ncbi:unnamed protein product [Effrenium voratum]|nr:unnamed protein product [Effrenium voratum]